MPETVEDLEARRALIQARYDKVIAAPASQSAGDRSWAEWDPAILRREIEHIDAKLAALTAPQSSGRTALRLRRAR